MFERIDPINTRYSDRRRVRRDRLAMTVVLSASLVLGACAQTPWKRAQAPLPCAPSGARIDVDTLERAWSRYRLALENCTLGSVDAGSPTPAVSLVPVIRIDPPVATPVAPSPSVPSPRLQAPRSPGRPAATQGSERAALARQRLESQVQDVAQRNELDPLLLHAVIHVESRHRSDAVSPAGARGAMQVMPATGERFGVQNPRQLHDDAFNLAAGAAYLKLLSGEFAGNLELMLAAYNAGEGAVRRHGGRIPPYPETQAYVRDVLGEYRRLKARAPGYAELGTSLPEALQ